jgi:D-inositol-3-phosphate glycosyltransferase
MRIALVAEHSDAGTPAGLAAAADSGGQPPPVSALARTLAGLGHSVTIYAPADDPSAPQRGTAAAGVTVEHLAAGPAGAAAAAARPTGGPASAAVPPHLADFSDKLAARLRKRPPDVVHAHFWTSGLAALAASRGLPLPVVQTFYSLGTAERRHPGAAGDLPARVRLEAAIARSVAAVLAASTGELSQLTAIGVPRTAIRVVPYGVDTTFFLPDGPVARRSRRPRLLAISPLSGQHGLDTVVRALAQVPRAELLIIGGPPRDELAACPGYAELARLAGQLRVADRILFTGQVSRARLPALLRSADLLVDVAPCQAAGTGPLEAMACGTPVVAAEGGGSDDAVVDGATGAVIPPGRPELLARRIRQLLASPMLLQGYGIAAADRIRARYSWERIGTETLAAYQRARAACAVTPRGRGPARSAAPARRASALSASR